MEYDFGRILTCQILTNPDGAIRRLMGQSDAGTPICAATVSAEAFDYYPLVKHLNHIFSKAVMKQMMLGVVNYR